MNNPILSSAAAGLALTWSLILPSSAFAVGAGIPFDVEEYDAGMLVNSFTANSADFTYHGCVQFVMQGRFMENGYFWLSSYQGPSKAKDSEINYFDTNGYKIYGIYKFSAGQFGAQQVTPTGNRLNYVVLPNSATIELYLDPNKDTKVSYDTNCVVTTTDNLDDTQIGFSNTLAEGEKSETDGLANGDFELVFDQWNWVLPNPIVPDPNSNYQFLRFNANVTRLQGPLGNDHEPEGSGNLFWRDQFTCIPIPGFDQICPH